MMAVVTYYSYRPEGLSFYDSRVCELADQIIACKYMLSVSVLKKVFIVIEPRHDEIDKYKEFDIFLSII